jgi:hypothetical protein
MSLIDEALRRARQEASRQDAARRDERYRQVPVLPPMASRKRSPSVSPALIAAAVAVCIVAGIAIGIFLGRDRGEERIADAPVAPVESTPPSETPRPGIVVEETPEPTPVPAKPIPVPTPPPTPEPRQEVPIAPVAPVSPISDTEPVNPTPDATPVLTPTPPPEPTPAAPAPAPEIRTYVREVPLPDGGTLRLNGIAFSSDRPVALINDRVLGKGEGYQGFVVTDIQAGMVELQGNGMTVRVSLK